MTDPRLQYIIEVIQKGAGAEEVRKELDALDKTAEKTGKQIEDVGRKSKTTAQELEKIDGSGRRAAQGLEQTSTQGQRASKELDKIDHHAKEAGRGLTEVGDKGRRAGKELQELDGHGRRVARTADDMSGSFGRLLTILGTGFLIRQFIETNAQLQRTEAALMAVAGSTEGAKVEMDFLLSTARRLGLDLNVLEGAYRGILAATKDTNLEGAQTREIFLGVVEASAALGLSSDQTRGTLLALQQMISKGRVSAEEFRGQLGERLPVALRIASEALGVTTQEFSRMLDNGEIVAEEFLPKFAARLRESFGEASTRNLKTLSGQIAAIKNELVELQRGIGQQGANEGLGLIFSHVAAGLRLINDNQDALAALNVILGRTVTVVGALAVAFAGLKVKQLLDLARTGAGMAAVAARVSLAVNAFLSLKDAINLVIEAWHALESQKLLEHILSKEKAQANELRFEAIRQATLMNSEGQLDAATLQQIRESLGAGDADANVSIDRVRSVLKFLQAGGSASSPAAAAAEPTKAQKEQMEQLRELERELLFEQFQGFDLQRARLGELAAERLAQVEALAEKEVITAERKTELIAQIEENLRSAEEEARRKDQEREAREAEQAEREKQQRIAAEQAEARKKRRELDAAANAEIQAFEQRLTTVAIGSAETRSERINREFQQRLEFYDRLLEKGLITEGRLAELRLDAKDSRLQSLGSLAPSGEREIDRLTFSPREFELSEIERLWEERREMISAYYDFEMAKAEENATRINELEAQKAEHLQALEKTKQFATSETGQLIIQVGRAAAQQFASGMSSALVSFVTGTKDAQAAFQQFAAEFLRSIAQMIIQQIILNSLKSAFPKLFAADGAVVPAPSPAAAGGYFPAHYRAAATGAILSFAGGGVAGGVPGTETVSSPTFFPRFNVLAGEAGQEVMTVLARPERANINGMEAIIGRVGASRLALMDANALLQPPAGATFAAEGTVTSGSGPLTLGSGSGARVSEAGGRLRIEIALGADLEARIKEEAVQGAEISVLNKMHEDGPMSQAVKELSR